VARTRSLLLASSAALALACGRASAPGPRPNFVLILADDLGWADVGYQGSTFHRTPHIDALARDGLVFSQAYAASPVCTPSRAALLTGCSPARLHITFVFGENAPFEDLEERLDDEAPGKLLPPTVRDRLPDGIPTLASGLKELGYRTGLVGKWHLAPAPGALGFDVQVGASPAGAVGSYFSPYGLPTLRDGPTGEYLTDRLTAEAERFLEANRERPFLLVLSHYAPHTPLEAPEALVEEYRVRADPTAPQRNPTYAAMIERLDDSVGRVRAALERLGLAEKTLLVFTSDNGAFEGTNTRRRSEPITSNLPLRSGKGRVYEGGLRVPMIAWGGVAARRGTCAVPVVGTDLCPTLLALAGHPPFAVSDGVDLTPLLRGSGSIARDEIAFHFPHESFASALRVGDEKLVYSWKRERSELFDLAADPGEQHDLASARPERAAELERRLFTWLDEVGADRPVRR
jgi:arylsulfatase A-like enzyme